MIPFWKKTGKYSKPQSVQKRRQNAKPAVPRTAQQSIPMQRMFEDGTCRVKPNYYTRTIQYQDINNLRYTSSHRNCRYTGGTNQRVSLATVYHAHQQQSMFYLPPS